MLAGPVHVHHAPAMLHQTADCRFKVAEYHYIRKQAIWQQYAAAGPSNLAWGTQRDITISK